MPCPSTGPRSFNEIQKLQTCEWFELKPYFVCQNVKTFLQCLSEINHIMIYKQWFLWPVKILYFCLAMFKSWLRPFSMLIFDKNFSNFLSPAWKLDNPYYHTLAWMVFEKWKSWQTNEFLVNACTRMDEYSMSSHFVSKNWISCNHIKNSKWEIKQWKLEKVKILQLRNNRGLIWISRYFTCLLIYFWFWLHYKLHSTCT